MAHDTSLKAFTMITSITVRFRMVQRKRCVQINQIIFLMCLINFITKSDSVSVRMADNKVYVVTPEPVEASEGRKFPYFIPTPIQDQEEVEYPVFSTSHPDDDHVPSNSFEYHPFLPTPLPNNGPVYNDYYKNKYTTEKTPDIIMAEFNPGRKNEGMISVKEMLTKEKITKPKMKEKGLTESKANQGQNMKVEDVWDIINHNKDLEVTTKKLTLEKPPTTEKSMDKYKVKSGYTKSNVRNEEALKTSEVLISQSVDSLSVDDSKTKVNGKDVEIFPSVAVDAGEWSTDKPDVDSSKNDRNGMVQIDEPRNIRGNDNTWNFPNSRNPKPVKTNYYNNNYQKYDGGYSYGDSAKYSANPSIDVAQDRYNPAQPYLPPKPDVDMPPPKRQKPPMPLPPVPMPPPPPPPKPQPLMGPPSISYDSYQGDSKPPDSSDYSFPSFDDNGPPSDDSFKYGPPSDSDSYPPSFFDDHHPHYHDDDHDHDHYPHHHHHHHHMPPATTTTTTTTPAPMKRDNNRFSYYYLGKKLWYLPLYFSVYFIIYVGALIIKSIARHKITYPQHYKTKRDLGGLISEETINNLSRLTSNAIIKMTERYLEQKLG